MKRKVALKRESIFYVMGCLLLLAGCGKQTKQVEVSSSAQYFRLTDTLGMVRADVLDPQNKGKLLANKTSGFESNSGSIAMLMSSPMFATACDGRLYTHSGLLIATTLSNTPSAYRKPICVADVVATRRKGTGIKTTELSVDAG